ncbi:MAG: hypothetical protein H7Z14_22415 [Anaerolineae bacterium]|nr:hypothetical protein [Phycisphaerae bacterium]
MPTELAPPIPLSYELAGDAHAEDQRARWWILCGGVIFGLLGFAASVAQFAAQVVNNLPLSLALVDKLDLQFYLLVLLTAATYAIITAVSWLAIRGKVGGHSAFWPLIICCTLLTAFFVFSIVGSTRAQSGLSIIDFIAWLSYFAPGFIWPAIMVRASADKLQITRCAGDDACTSAPRY